MRLLTPRFWTDDKVERRKGERGQGAVFLGRSSTREGGEHSQSITDASIIEWFLLLAFILFAWGQSEALPTFWLQTPDSRGSRDRTCFWATGSLSTQRVPLGPLGQKDAVERLEKQWAGVDEDDGSGATPQPSSQGDCSFANANTNANANRLPTGDTMQMKTTSRRPFRPAQPWPLPCRVFCWGTSCLSRVYE